MSTIGTIGYASTIVVLLALTIEIFRNWHGQVEHALLVVTGMLSTSWALFVIYLADEASSLLSSLFTIELLRDLAWLSLLYLFVYSSFRNLTAFFKATRVLFWFVLGLLFLLIFAAAYLAYFDQINDSMDMGFYFSSVVFIIISIIGLFFTENIFRHSSSEERKTKRYFCIGAGVIFTYDFFMYADALFFTEISQSLWDSRGIVNTLALLVLSVPIIRKEDWAKEIYLSHSIVFQATTVLACCFYLLLMVSASIYFRSFSGETGEFLQIIFLFVVTIFLLFALSSKRLRAVLKIYVSKHFFNYKYDYREEWQRFIRTLSKGGAGVHLLERTAQAIALIVDSPGSMLWLRSEKGSYEPAASWEMPEIKVQRVQAGSSLVQFLEHWQWVIDFNEYDSDPDLYRNLEVPHWMKEIHGAWLVVPLMQDVQLLGFVLLLRSPGYVEFNWEDRDLLKTAGRQSAAHIAQLMATQALIDAREFQTFSRLSAFVIHDLKNLVSQLSLVVTNASKYKNNPEFMEDAIDTVDNSVSKMNKLLQQLRSNTPCPSQKTKLSLNDVVKNVCVKRSTDSPAPEFTSKSQEIVVIADKDRLFSVLEHVIQNAQEAAHGTGSVSISTRAEDGVAILEIVDTGCGMSNEFIQHRLFRPFDSTKGSTGMGIGAYQCKEYINSLNGEVDVESEPDTGTTFRISLPLVTGGQPG
ncbi:MAG: XrtA/PEP-CTERM system histidine kinase PrsK [Gammaproteobacteria bacterium]